ncbi:protein KTI12 homolog [Diabrotica undecimpunctata]|uniref:protein KTI12 homolog n=1 Tax=Diabrotica undecimpunctata TaxID=50387 RepID=UPI003B6400F7
MPLIVITGVPSSGKTTRSQELRKFFEEQGKEVRIISELDHIVNAGFEKNSFYDDKDKEKHIRGLLKSEVLKLVSANNIVILDALNYIKGYRYELFCGTKANKCTQCTVHTEINREEAWQFNENRTSDIEKYNRETFDALVMRYEDPNGNNRWDAPLFTIFPNQDLDLDNIYASLFKKKAPKPNMSTQNPPLKSTNFLYDLDQVTKKIVDELVKEKKNGNNGVITVTGFDDLNIDISNMSIQQIMNSRRQYITYSKMHAPDPDKIPKLFVQFLATTLK